VLGLLVDVAVAELVVLAAAALGRLVGLRSWGFVLAHGHGLPGIATSLASHELVGVRAAADGPKLVIIPA
jgi:hypothetical protein